MEFDSFFRNATGRPPYAYQQVFAQAPRLPDLLEAPTGSGKTATAVLGWLWRRLHGNPEQQAEAGRRLVFCLPMRTLVEQTEKAVLQWRDALAISPSELGVHSLLGGAVDDAWDSQPERPAILIGTQDQLLSRALMRGYAMSRFRWPVHFAWLNSDCTWVMDEVQLMGVGASTAAQLQAFREQLGTAGSCRTVWMTATLDEGRLRTVDFDRPLQRQPFASGGDEALERRLHASKRLHRAATVVGKKPVLAPLATEIAAAHVPGTLTLVVCNRVVRAQELCSLLRKDDAVEAVALIHSRFRPAERRAVQAAALSGSFKGILVATQAIEAGVDISARTLFTELAPWSSLVQRFGRLNRAGEHPVADAYWIDLGTDDDDACLPYERAVLETARTRIEALSAVDPTTLGAVARETDTPALPVLRRKDLLELFDTEPDLAGYDLDVSQYIRATDDRDVQVAWRDLGGRAPGDDAPDLHRDELCGVPHFELAKLAGKKKIWRFDGLRRRWVAVDSLFAGLTVVVDVSVGGYDPALGFTRDKRDVPAPIDRPAAPPDSDAADDLSFASEFVQLRVHAQDTAEDMQALLGALSQLTAGYVPDSLMIDAARWHDLGKVHPAFQALLTQTLSADDPRRDGGPWAKSDRAGGRNPRRHFRHELASALCWLDEGRDDLGAFLIAAHHGKVRLTIRARPGEEGPGPGVRFAHGVHDGDALDSADLGAGVEVPARRLSLACMELGGGGQGPSWSSRMADLLRSVGPFRLAYLESLVRVADWRASARRSRGATSGVSHD